MKKRKLLSLFMFLLALVLGVIFYFEIESPQSIWDYFDRSYLGQFGPVAICVELLIAAYYLYIAHQKTNFTLALFAFTVLLDILLSLSGVFESGVPIYGMVLFFITAIISLWISFTNAFELGKITLKATLFSFLVGVAIELYFNYV